MMSNISFKHSGRLGDIIYSLPLIRVLSQAKHTKADLYIRNDDYYDVNESVFHPGNGVTVSQALFDYLAPLLNDLEYLAQVRYCATEDIPSDAIDLDLFKKSGLNLHASGNQIWYRKAHSIPVPFEQKWLEFGTELSLHPNEKRYEIIINKSTRYYNKSINYGFLDEISSAGFVGLRLEYEHFVAKHGLKRLDFIPTSSALDLARQIANAKVFIGNQSLAFAIAEGLKLPRAVEVYEPIPVVIPIGGTCIEFVRTNQLIGFLRNYCALQIQGEYPDLTGGFVDSILDEKPPKLSKRLKTWWKEVRGKVR